MALLLKPKLKLAPLIGATVNGTGFNDIFSNNATTDSGTADANSWIDTNGVPISELGHMCYVTLGNFGVYSPDNHPWWVEDDGKHCIQFKGKKKNCKYVTTRADGSYVKYNRKGELRVEYKSFEEGNTNNL